MKVSKIHLLNFKRFSDLLIDNIPETAKLVLLIGSNGSGKSSVFDAFGYFDAYIKKDINTNSDYFQSYYVKNKKLPIEVTLKFTGENEVTLNDVYNPEVLNKRFYGRTSFRQIPRLTRTTLGAGGQIDFEKDSDRSHFLIEKDSRFENDVEKITETILKELFRTKQSNEEIRAKYIEPINTALSNIFGTNNGTKLELIEIIPPLEGKVAQITFRKGHSEIHYNFLSAGEKEVFNLLINLLTRIAFYQDAIYYLDEIDLHLNTKIQFNLLKEITENWIPENSQLWTASHSLGFIEYAKQTDFATIIDFDDLDFDVPRVLTPEPKDNPDIYEIAVGKAFLPSLFQHMNIYFVENKDRDYYAELGISNTVFVSDNNRNNVFHKVRTTQYFGIIDRDFLSDEDVLLIKEHYPNLRILDFYSIENLMYHPDNLAEYYGGRNQVFDKKSYISQLTAAKNEVKDSFIPTLSLKRTEYPFFGEPEYNGKTLQNRFKNKQENAVESAKIAGYLNSNDFQVYYKSLPMKTYCTHLPQRQNIPKNELIRTNWFKIQIEHILKVK